MERVRSKQTLLYVKQIDSGICRVTQGTQTGLCNNLEGSDRGRRWEGGGIGIPMADSYCCLAETSTML